MMIEALRNVIHREVQRVMDRRIRRIPCIVDAYNPSQHTVKVKLQPSGTLTGWMQIETDQVGLMIAPNVGDPGWLEFHEADRRAAVFVGSNHNDNFPPPKVIAAGEWYYQNKSGSSLYFKTDGSVTAKDNAGASIVLNGGTITIADKAGSALKFNGDGTLQITGTLTGAHGTSPLEATADIITTGDVVADGKSLKAHVHSGVQAGGSDTGPPV